MSTARRPPRRSSLAGGHPAVPVAARVPDPASPPQPESPATPEKPATAETVPFPVSAPNPETPSRSQKLTVNIDRQLIDQAKDAFWLARGEYRTFSAWVEAALRRHIDATKEAHGVDELPQRPGGPLPPGRPLS
jgi:hypothetical protein